MSRELKCITFTDQRHEQRTYGPVFQSQRKYTHAFFHGADYFSFLSFHPVFSRSEIGFLVIHCLDVASPWNSDSTFDREAPQTFLAAEAARGLAPKRWEYESRGRH